MARHPSASPSTLETRIVRHFEPGPGLLGLAPPLVLLPVNRYVPLEGTGVGWLLREWRRSVGSPGLALVTSRSHADDLCAYLRREKTGAEVVVVPDADLPSWWSGLEELALIEVDPDGRPGRIVSGPSGPTLLASWREEGH